MKGGPFAGVRKSDKLDNLVNESVRLCPVGIPERHTGWRRPRPAVGNMDYFNWAKDVFARTAPTPISNILVSKELRPQIYTPKCSARYYDFSRIAF